MKCEQCHESPATVHVTEIVSSGGEKPRKKEKHLCERCAHAEGEGPGSLELVELLSSFASGSPPGSERQNLLVCDACGLGYQQFRGKGRVGCPECYDAFSQALTPLLEKIHGGKHHVGKTPRAGGSVDRARERLLVELRRKLQAAVKDEHYEEAARLRDELEQVGSAETAAAAEVGETAELGETVDGGTTSGSTGEGGDADHE